MSPNSARAASGRPSGPGRVSAHRAASAVGRPTARSRSASCGSGSTPRNRSANPARASAVGLPSTRSLAIPPSG